MILYIVFNVPCGSSAKLVDVIGIAGTAEEADALCTDKCDGYAAIELGADYRTATLPVVYPRCAELLETAGALT